jgi:proliferating cell nuclear antigen
MSFSLKLDQIRVLRVIIETLASIVTEAKFKVTPKGLVILAFDDSRICLLQLKIKEEDFDAFSCDEKLDIDLNIDDLDKILKRSTLNDSLEMSFNKEDNKIKIKLQREIQEEKKLTRTFSLVLSENEIEDLPLGRLYEIEYNARWEIDSSFLVEAIKDAEIYSEVLSLKATEGEGLLFTSIGSIGEMEYLLDLDDLKSSNIDETCMGSYSLDFLKAILKISSITLNLEMGLKSDYPLKIIFKLENNCELSLFLAPRVEHEEDEEDDDDMDEF